MALESATFITQLVPGNPVGATDPVSQGDDHLRLLKSVLQATFPNLNAAVNATPAQLNTLVGVTGFAAPANKVGTAANAAGAAGTWLRSDCTIQIDLALVYGWTNAHDFAGGNGTTAAISISRAANDVFVRCTTQGVQDWVYGNRRSDGAFIWAAATSFGSGVRLTLTAAGNLTVNSGSLDAISGVFDNGARVIDVPRRTSGFARGQCLAISAGVTLNTSDLAAGYTFSVYNDSAAAITLTQGAGVTLRLGGSTTTGNRTIAARGIATIWSNSGTEAIVTGAGVT